MGRFLAGLLVGLLAGLGGAYLAWRPEAEPTVAAAPQADPPDEPPARPKKRSGRRARTASSGTVGEEEPTRPLSAADRRLVARGDALELSDRRLDFAAASESRDLTQAEIDGAFAARADELVRCIADARGSAPLAGRVTAGVVVDDQGVVRRSRVEAPAYLHEAGLYDCMRPILRSLRFPATGKDSVVTVPFDVE